MLTKDAWSTIVPLVPIEVPEVVLIDAIISVSLKFITCIVGVMSSKGTFWVAVTPGPPVRIPTLAVDVVGRVYESNVGSSIAVCVLLISVSGIPSRL